MTFQKLAVYFHCVGHRAKLLDYYTFHPFASVWEKVLDHHCLSWHEATKSGMMITMNLLIGLFRDNTGLAIWPEQIKPCSQSSPKEKFTWEGVGSSLWWHLVTEQELGQSLVECPSFSLTGLHVIIKDLNEPLIQPIEGWVVWGWANVLDAVQFHELSKFVRGELGTIIWHDLFRQAIAREKGT